MGTIGSLLVIPQKNPKYEFPMEQLLISEFDIMESELVCDVVGPNSPWYQDKFDYIQYGIIPPDLTTSQKKTFVSRTSQFTILGDTLYRWSLDETLLWCLNMQEAQTAL